MYLNSVKVLFFLTTSIFLSGCGSNSQDLKHPTHQIIDNINTEIIHTFQKAKEIGVVLTLQVVQLQDNQIKALKNNERLNQIDEQIKEEIKNTILNLTKKQAKEILECMQSSSEPTASCTNKMTVVMTPVSLLMQKHSWLTNTAFTDYVMSKNWVSSNITSEECASFKTGSFFTISPFNQNDTTSYIRGDYEQAEITELTKNLFKIQWINDCTYSLTPQAQSEAEKYSTEIKILDKIKNGYRYIQELKYNNKTFEKSLGIIFKK